MAASKATTVDAYLSELPPERRGVIAELRRFILTHLPSGYEERMNWGMICYELPLAVYPNTYNKQPLAIVCLAAQKNYFALYLSCVGPSSERNAWLAAEFARAGKKLDIGKSCLRFRKLDDLVLEPLGQIIAETPPELLISNYEASRTIRGGC